MANSMENYVRALSRLETRISNMERNNQSQAFTSIENTRLEFRDEDGNVTGTLGINDDGSTGFVPVLPDPEVKEPRTLAVPSAPLLDQNVSAVAVTWDGLTVDHVEFPLDFYCLEIHASEEQGFTADDLSLVSALYETEPSSAVVGPILSGTWYFKLRLRARNGEVSEASAETSIEVELDLPTLNGKLANAGGGTNYYQPTPPTGEEPYPQASIWFDTSEDPDTGLVSYMPHHWTEADGWVSLEDERIKAIQDAQDLLRDELNTVIETAGSNNFYKPVAPQPTDATPPKEGDLWFDTSADGNNTAHYWNGTEWISLEDARINQLKQAQTDFTTELNEVQQTASDAQQSADSAQTSAESAQQTADQAKADAIAKAQAAEKAAKDYAEAQAEAARLEAIATASGDATAKANAAESKAKADAALDAKAKADAAQKAAEAKAAEAKSAADAAQATANDAKSKAEAAHTAAGNAQSAADAAMQAATHNAKNLFSTANPSGTAPKGTIWFKTDTSNRIIGQWQQTGGTDTTDGSTWTSRTLTNSVIANLDAGKITSGYIDVARLKAGSLDADVVLVPGSAGSTVIRNGAITTEKIATGSITAASGIISEIDASVITVGKLQGSIIAAQTIIGSDAILDGSLTAKSLKAGTITAQSGVIGSLDLGKATVGELDGVRIKSGTVNTDQLNSTAINGMEIVAAKIYTSKTGARIQLLTTGLSAYSSSNVRTFNIATNTGDVEMIGKLYTGTSGGYRTVLNQDSWDNFTEYPIYGGGSAQTPMVGSGLRMGKDSSVTTSAEVFYAEETYYTGTVSKYLRLNGPQVSSRRSELAIGTSGLIGGYRNTSNGLFLSSVSLDKGSANLRHEAPSTGVFSTVDVGEDSDGKPTASLWTSNSSKIGDNNSVDVNTSGIDLLAGDATFKLRKSNGNLYMNAAGWQWQNYFEGTGAANVYMTGTGWFQRGKSSRRYKLLEKPITEDIDNFSQKMLSIEPKSWFDKNASERWAEIDTLKATGKWTPEMEEDYIPDPLERIPGVIAEDLHEAGLNMFVDYDEDGLPDGVKYDRIGVALIAVLKEQNKRIEQLEDLIANT